MHAPRGFSSLLLPLLVTVCNAASSAHPADPSSYFKVACSGAHVTDSNTPYADCAAAIRQTPPAAINLSNAGSEPYTWAHGRCQITVRFDPSSRVETPTVALTEGMAVNWVIIMAQAIAHQCLVIDHATAGETWQHFAPWDGISAHVSVRIYADRNDPELVRWLAQRRKPGWMTDKQWKDELLLKWAEYINYGNASMWYP